MVKSCAKLLVDYPCNHLFSYCSIRVYFQYLLILFLSIVKKLSSFFPLCCRFDMFCSYLYVVFKFFLILPPSLCGCCFSTCCRFYFTLQVLFSCRLGYLLSSSLINCRLFSLISFYIPPFFSICCRSKFSCRFRFYFRFSRLSKLELPITNREERKK